MDYTVQQKGKIVRLDKKNKIQLFAIYKRHISDSKAQLV